MSICPKCINFPDLKKKNKCNAHISFDLLVLVLGDWCYPSSSIIYINEPPEGREREDISLCREI
jgi:hypothetical protein